MEKKARSDIKGQYQVPFLLVWIWNNIWKVLTWVAGIVVFILGIAQWNSATIMTLFILLLAGCFQARQAWLDHKIEQKNDQVEKENQDLKKENQAFKESIPAITASLVIDIFERLKLKEDDRLTLYLFSDNQFRLCSRHSRNPNYKKFRRTSYDTDRGVIGKVWSDGWCFDNAFPDPKDKKQYAKYCKKKYNLSPNEVKELSMQARFYCGIRISDSLNRTPFAMLIIESMDFQRFSCDTLKKALEQGIRPFTSLLEDSGFRKYIPNQGIVEQEEGF